MKYAIEVPEKQEDYYHKYDFVVGDVKFPLYAIGEDDEKQYHLLFGMYAASDDPTEIRKMAKEWLVWAELLEKLGDKIAIEFESEDADEGYVEILGWINEDTYLEIIINSEL